ncbi:MAG: bifunctional phosphopantothenoylcysteine decarboxylase/phosphopantothenate--cysteine ligase CoaBC [Rickettsiales bacterium]|nr:bifunctional phosphopantothenoylcysteine decarboxylase/phosphopantothenate--cysteine ligase CoaBC [Rickettsiales bacterium]
MKKILLIITGSIASYKSMDLVRLLKKANYDVSCVLTKAAEEFITPLLASSLSGNKTYNELFNIDDELDMGHINLSRKTDLIVVAPASANFISKMANGIGDDLASTTLLAANKDIIIAPAMNEKMWLHSATQENLKKLSKSHIEIIDPQKDVLACGELGIGKMAEPQNIFEKIEEFFLKQNLLKNKNIMITAGSTYEPIDPVRFIGNRSTGTQAIELANVLAKMGANVTMIAGNITQNIALPEENIIRVGSTQEMFDAVTSNLNNIDCFIGCAAVSDYKVKNPSTQKIKKDKNKDGKDTMTLELVENPDILDFVGNHQTHRPKLVVGFAAESDNLEKYATDKLNRKNCDIVLANNIDNGRIFGNAESEAMLISKTKTRNLGKTTKNQIAKIIAEAILEFS